MSVRVSVVIPCFKCAAWIEETLDSVARQTYPSEDLEILVIDDASPDDSGQVAGRFLEKRSLNGRVVRQEKNAGLAATRNVGLKLASGDWINFLDADDLLAPHKIELQARLAAEASDDVAVVYSNWRHFTLQDGKWQPTGPTVAPFVDRDPVLQILQELNFGYVGPTLVRKSFVDRIGGFDETLALGEDCDLMLRLAMAGGQFREARSDGAAFLYRQSPNSLWRQCFANPAAMRGLLLGFRNVEAFLRGQSPDRSLSDDARAALARRYARFADLYFENDLATFRMVMGWLKELGLDRPVDLKPRVRALSSVIGYENTLRLRAAYRSLRS